MENLVINPITKEYGRYENNNNLKFKIGSLYNPNQPLQVTGVTTDKNLESYYLIPKIYEQSKFNTL